MQKNCTQKDIPPINSGGDKSPCGVQIKSGGPREGSGGAVFRSIIAEALLNRLGQGKFKAYSAGSQPKGEVHPYTLQLLKGMNYDTSFARSKNWDEFAVPGAPELDFVFTVCDNAAAEACPVWPGQPMTAHWGVPDPAGAEGTEAEKHFAFAEAYRMLNHRISIFVSLPMMSLDKLSLQKRLNEIGSSTQTVG